ncbi:MAG: DUF3784 domain-containing protein [Cyclobacteriaceae bacterium]
MITIHSIAGAFLILLGFLVKKYPHLIAGYDSLSAEQKGQVAIDKVANRMKTTFIIVGILVTIAGPILNSLGLTDYLDVVIPSIIIVGCFSMFIHSYASKHK